MTDTPKWGRGRPTKAQQAERQQMAETQERERAARIVAAEETFLDENLSGPYKRKGKGLAVTEEVIQLVFAFSKIGATQEEISSALGISRRVFYDLMQKHPDLKDAHESGLDHARISLRRKQFRLADKLAPMAIFLGKNMLDQKDVHEVKNLNGKEAAIKATDEELMRIIRSGKTGEIKRDEDSILQ